MKQFRLPLVAIVASLMMVCGCTRNSAGRTRAETEAVTLHVAAASDLQLVLPELIEAYRALAPGVTIVPVPGSSGQLAQQVKAGAPFDLFLAANEAYVRDLATEHYILAGSIRPYAVGSLVVAVRDDLATPFGTLADLTKPGVKRVVIANPETAPYGAAARQALRNAGVWDAIGPKLVIAESVRQALTYVETGDAEAGLVGRAGARASRVRSVEVDPKLYDPLVQALGVVARTEHAEAAEAFARFIVSDAALKVFSTHGFQRPRGK